MREGSGLDRWTWPFGVLGELSVLGEVGADSRAGQEKMEESNCCQ